MYSGLWRYVDATQNIFLNFPPTSRIARPIDYLLREAGWLLYHELGHASDFLPPSERPRLNNSLALAPWDFLRTVTRPSSQLGSALPLQSAQMLALAEVKFRGAAATDEQRAYTPDMVASFFAPDRATDEYSYSSGFEDLAMLFEEFMMLRNHGWRRDVGITDKITSSSTSSNIIVRWGQRGRIGEASIKPRVELVVGQLAPWVALAEVQNVPAPLAMRSGDSWAGNLVLPAPVPGLAGAQAARMLDAESDRALLARSVAGRHRPTPNDRWLRRPQPLSPSG
jgi:hypothetical protein